MFQTLAAAWGLQTSSHTVGHPWSLPHMLSIFELWSTPTTGEKPHALDPNPKAPKPQHSSITSCSELHDGGSKDRIRVSWLQQTVMGLVFTITASMKVKIIESSGNLPWNWNSTPPGSDRRRCTLSTSPETTHVAPKDNTSPTLHFARSTKKRTMATRKPRETNRSGFSQHRPAAGKHSDHRARPKHPKTSQNNNR